MNLGIFGGTFNPPHMGHLIVIESVQDQMRFDKILFIPSAKPPHKNDPLLAPATARLEMTALAIQNARSFEVSDVEIQRTGKSYTVDTISMLMEIYPGSNFSFIIGADNYMELDTWKSPDEIFAKAGLIVMTRPGYASLQPKHQFARIARFMNVPSIGISSTDIRRRVKHGRSIRYLVPPAVGDYITAHALYRNE